MIRRCKIKSILWPITVMFLLVYSSKLDYFYIQLSLVLLLNFDSSVKYSHEAFMEELTTSFTVLEGVMIKMGLHKTSKYISDLPLW